MEIKFEGDVKSLTPERENICRKVLKEKGFTNCVVQVEAVCKKGDNYGANVKRFITFQDSVNNGIPFKMIGKLAPINEKVRKMIGTETAFSNEIVVYDKLFPKYEEIQNETNLLESERLKNPKCFAVSTQSPYEMILLEDVEDIGFFALNRLKLLTNEQVKITLKELAKLHGLSYVLKFKDPSFFENIKKELINLAIRTEFEDYLVTCEEDTQNMLKNEHHRNRVKGLVANIVKVAKRNHDYDINDNHSAIVHGDCWTNNMMYQIQDSHTVDIKMLDFQITRIATPPTDVFYFILNSSDYETKHKYYNNWLDYYYNSFSEFLAYFNLEVSKIYTRELFDEDLKRTAKASMGLTIMLSKLVVRDPEDITDYKETGASALPEIPTTTKFRDVIIERFNNRVEDLIKFCIEINLI